MEEKKLTIGELSVLTGISVHTLDSWYRFKKAYPDNEYAKILPEFTRGKEVNRGTAGQRYWDRNDIWKIVEFKNSIPKGRNGVMGAITQKHYRKQKKETVND